MMGHTCNSSFWGGGDQEDLDLRPVHTKSETLSQKQAGCGDSYLQS
jgi:hypothetical protein